jgi:hypothetical protein
MLFIATATHVVSLGGASLVVVATVLELLPAVDEVDVPKTNVPLLLVVQLTRGPDTIVVNKDDEVVVLKAGVEVSVGNKLADDVVLTIVVELEYPPYKAITLLYICCQEPVFPLRLQWFSPSSKKL